MFFLVVNPAKYKVALWLCVCVLFFLGVETFAFIFKLLRKLMDLIMKKIFLLTDSGTQMCLPTLAVVIYLEH